jgi:hypothetical protein
MEDLVMMAWETVSIGQWWVNCQSHFRVVWREQPPGLNQSEPTSSGSQPVREFTGSQFLNIPSPPAAEAVELSVINAHFLPTSDSHFMPDPHAQYNNSRDDFRPSSAQSHSASEYSWSSTDVDNDSNMSDTGSLFHVQNDQLQGINLDGMNMGAGPSNQYWQHHTQLNGHDAGSVKTEAPGNELHNLVSGSVSPADIRSSVGPIRGNSEDQTAKLQRLERKLFGTHVVNSSSNRSTFNKPQIRSETP